MSIAQQIEAKGKMEGWTEYRAEGEHAAKKMIAQKLLQQNMSAETVAQVTGLPFDDVALLTTQASY